MKTTIEVQSKKEGELIKRALDDPETRAFVQIVGALLPFTQRTRTRVLNFVKDQLEEEEELRSEGK
ncbi:MAG: hypothetical protein AUG51_09395 [Acidobacteria bacterium 13_1_20CM_3_53_8]|nr:MAG: hypothetical protein AUG51_09395 [Acidobacteria bacterium 13_1_20CM_3_53_8]